MANSINSESASLYLDKQDDHFERANTLIREGRHREVHDLFAKLKELRPDFSPYAFGYELARNRLAEQSRIPVLEAVHPGSRPVSSDKASLFVVTTPVFSGEQFLESTLQSVLDQAGDFFIDYYVKDAGSTDQTLPILKDYLDRIASGSYPLHCFGIRLRVESSPDGGLYDAVGHAFSQPMWRSDPGDIMTYINADDVLEANAFRIADDVFRFTRAQWLTGQVKVINQLGEEIASPRFPLPYSSEDIAVGHHDGRTLNFIQQEGTFWLRRLYELSGGITRQLKLAGDFDLWRRFSMHTELLALDRPLAAFRSREGQLSAQIDRYYAEVDELIGKCTHREESPNIENQPQFSGTVSPLGGRQQRPGPVCFLNEDGSPREVCYLKRSWYCW
jgi:hypothetical protein